MSTVSAHDQFLHWFLDSLVMKSNQIIVVSKVYANNTWKNSVAVAT